MFFYYIDGEPTNKPAVIKEIEEAANKLQNKDDLSVTFIQIGEEKNATEFLDTLDNDLSCEYDIVDCISKSNSKNMSFSKLIEKSLK